MGSCLYGSQKKDGAQNQFSITDTGGFCFALGLNATICPLIDIIPTLIGLPWRKIVKKIGEKAFKILVDEATGQIDTADFCSKEPPPLPEDINYLDVFNWIASYAPIVGGFADSDPLLKKITAYYLYTKWFEFCECKKKDFPPLPPDTPSSPFASSCPASSIYAAQVQAFIDGVDARNLQAKSNYPQYNGLINGYQRLNLTADMYDYYLSCISGNAEYQAAPNPYNRKDGFDRKPSSGKIGCVGVFDTSKGILQTYDIGVSQNILTGQNVEFYLVKTEYGGGNAYFDDSACCPPEIVKPPNPKITKDEPPITPPQPFCDLFPDSPFCNKLPPPQPCDIESVSVIIFDGCGEDRKSESRTLFKSGLVKSVSVIIFDGCGEDRKSESRTLFDC